MASVGRFFTRIIFWTYERGTAPYDIAVALIVVFVLLTPRAWFHDRPVIGPPPSEATVVQTSADPASGTQTYQVDARLLASPMPETELEKLIHDTVRKNVPELKGRNFKIVHFTQILGPNGIVLYYEVSIKP